MCNRASGTLTHSGGHQRSVNRDVITLRPELLQRHLLHPPAGRHLGRSDGVVSNGLKGPREPSEMQPEVSGRVSAQRRPPTLIPNDCILEATSFPILPSPTIPSTFPKSSEPMNWKIRNKTMSSDTALQKNPIHTHTSAISD